MILREVLLNITIPDNYRNVKHSDGIISHEDLYDDGK